jgi:hypothetical protein
MQRERWGAPMLGSLSHEGAWPGLFLVCCTGCSTTSLFLYPIHDATWLSAGRLSGTQLNLSL